ncbi:MAG TPA: DinB family protein [Candidatus Acidoferrales bacterium]|nr:DinB family protein [Candidatus Acidoferrales bacterium]
MKSVIAELIGKYADQPGNLIAAVEGLKDSELDKRLGEGKWSIRQQVNHLADSEMNMVQRMKKIIAEDTPLLPAYDQDRWADSLFYSKSSVDDSVALFFMLRTSMTRVLKKMGDKDFDRCGIHTETGKVTLLSLLEDTVEHADHHVKMIGKIKSKFKIK